MSIPANELSIALRKIPFTITHRYYAGGLNGYLVYIDGDDQPLFPSSKELFGAIHALYSYTQGTWGELHEMFRAMKES
jgi:hypothetical protein